MLPKSTGYKTHKTKTLNFPKQKQNPNFVTNNSHQLISQCWNLWCWLCKLHYSTWLADHVFAFVFFFFDPFSRVYRYEVVKCEVVYLPNFSMSDDMIIHFSSNSSNHSDQSLPTKIAKLEARMVGRDPSAVPATSTAPATWSSASVSSKFVPAENLAELGTSSDSDDDVSQFFFHFLLYASCVSWLCYCFVVHWNVRYFFFFCDVIISLSRSNAGN